MKALTLLVRNVITDTMLIEIYGERILLDATGSLYWKRKRWLIVSDLHLGKTMHFRKRGMALPKLVDQKDLIVLRELIIKYKPNKVVLLGDLFHSDYNVGWEQVANFTNEYRKNFFILVRGNHDILNEWHYGRSNMELVDELFAENFWFTHIPEDDPGDWINICGHVHPGIRPHGKARQSMRLSAFFFRTTSILVPAFSRFTGSVSIKPKKTDRVVAIAENSLVSIQ